MVNKRASNDECKKIEHGQLITATAARTIMRCLPVTLSSRMSGSSHKPKQVSFLSRCMVRVHAHSMAARHHLPSFSLPSEVGIDSALFPSRMPINNCSPGVDPVADTGLTA